MSSSEAPRRVGIVDLGSNTARLVVFVYEPGEWYRLVDSIREPVRLAAGLDDEGELSDEAIGRALAALELFADYADAAGVDELEVIATSAIRDARNSERVLDRLEDLGLPYRVLGGPEEAALGVAAVANSMTFTNAWIVDMGGGSAQISRMASRAYAEGDAHPLGALRLTERFLDGPQDAPPSREGVERLERELESRLATLTSSMARDDHPLVAMGGSVRNLAAIAQSEEGYPLDILHGYPLQRSAVEAMTERMLGMSASERRGLPGLNADRADTILAAALLFRHLLRAGDRDRVWISGHGLREGALFQQLLDPPHRVDDVRMFSVGNLFALYSQPAVHTRHVIRIALGLFDQLAPLHGLGSDSRELLAAAACLHDIGMTIGYYRHHKYGAFLLLNSGLDGFSHREIALLSLLIRWHRKGTPKIEGAEGLLDDGDLPLLLVLATCLRLAEHLERSRSGRLDGVRVEIGDDRVRLLLEAETHPAVEIWEASKDAELFELTFGRRLEIEAA